MTEVCARHNELMSDLGELLLLLHDADEPFQTLQARYRIWRHHGRLRAASLAQSRQSRGAAVAMGTFGRPPAPESAESEEVLHLWRVVPDRARVEHPSGERAGGYGVRIGGRWWSWDPRLGAMSNAEDTSVGSGIGEELGPVLDPARLLGPLHFEPLGPGTRAGRATILAEARPRAQLEHLPLRFELHELGAGAERYRLEFDSERGIVLAVHAFAEGEPFHVIEALELTVDGPLDPQLFEFQAPNGEEVRSPISLHRIRRHVSIAEAQAAAPFTVLIPERVPSSWTVSCTLIDAAERPPSGAAVHIHYRSDSGHESLNMTQGPPSDLQPEIDGDGWEKVRVGERVVQVRGRSENFPQSQLHLEHDGTPLLMVSDSVTAEQLIALAATLVPAPDAPSHV